MTALIESTVDGGGLLSRTQTTDAAAAVRQKTCEYLLQEIGFIYDSSFDQLEYEDVERAANAPDVLVDATASMQSRPEGLPAYIASLYAIPLLTAKGEAALFRKMNFLKYSANAIRSALDRRRPSEELIDEIEVLLGEAERVRSQLVQSNLRLVVSIARRFASDRGSFDELVSEGNLVLINAVEKFDYSRGFRFSTYVTHAVQRHFYRHCRNSQHRTNTEILHSEEFLREAAAASAEPVADAVSNMQLQAGELLSHMDQCLGEREQYIIRERFGFNSSGKTRTLQSLSEDLGVCKERVRQLFNKAVDKLRQLALDMNMELGSA